MDEQLNLAIRPQSMREPQLISWEIIKKLPNKKEAIRHCVYMSGLTNSVICAELNISPGQWSRIMGGNAHFPENKETRLMYLCGNYAPLQYQNYVCGFDMKARDRSKDEELKDIKYKLDKLLTEEVA